MLKLPGRTFYQTLQVFNFLVFFRWVSVKQPSEHFHEETAVDDSILLVEVNIHTFQISIPLLY